MGGQNQSRKPTFRVLAEVEPSKTQDGPRCEGSACGHPLELHQPDSGNPDRLLGTCPNCGTWYILDEIGDNRRTVRTRVPGASEVRAALTDRKLRTRDSIVSLKLPCLLDRASGPEPAVALPGRSWRT